MSTSAAFVVAMVLGTGPAAAQSFLDALFGWSQQKSSAPAQQVPATRQPATSTYRVPPNTIYSRPEIQRDSDEEQFSNDDELRPVKTGRLRAVCVRLCDGFYWPLNDRASRQTLKREAERCQATCGTEARLFYQDRESPDPSRLIDLAGRPYDSLQTAYLYRKKLISGCGCRPAPWSQAEMGRHRNYAIAEALAEQAKAARIAETTANGQMAQATAAARENRRVAAAPPDAAAVSAPLTRWPDAVVIAAIPMAPADGPVSGKDAEPVQQQVAGSADAEASDAAVALLEARAFEKRATRSTRTSQQDRASSAINPPARQARLPRQPPANRPQKVAASVQGFGGL
ncbi:MAG: DUF2865 domain-containing protein, partial [Hyphomicrobiaceae bacterium]